MALQAASIAIGRFIPRGDLCRLGFLQTLLAKPRRLQVGRMGWIFWLVGIVDVRWVGNGTRYAGWSRRRGAAEST